MKLLKYLSGILMIITMATALGCASTPQQEGTGEYIDDTVITTKIKAAVFNEPSLKSSEINVETFKGTVQLSGFVNSEADIAWYGLWNSHTDWCLQCHLKTAGARILRQCDLHWIARSHEASNHRRVSCCDWKRNLENNDTWGQCDREMACPQNAVDPVTGVEFPRPQTWPLTLVTPGWTLSVVLPVV